MTFLDFFAGVGTIRIGFEQAGWSCNGHVEWDKFAQGSYNAMHDIKEGEFCGWDIREVRADELPRSDLWTFGAPCQDFSIAGKRKGMVGERSSLVNEIFRLIEETPEENRPTWLLYENVKGMLSSNGGWDFLGILLEMDRLGYDVEWQMLNSKHFGVPQNRERVFTIGHLRGRGGRKVFPIEREGGASGVEIEPRLIGGIGEKNFGKQYRQSNRVYDADAVAMSLHAQSVGNAGGNSYLYAVKEPKAIKEEPKVNIVAHRDGYRRNTQTFSPDGITEALDTAQGGGRGHHVAIPVLTPDRIEKRQNGRRFKEDGDPMFTLTAQDRHGVAIMRPKRTDYGKRIRKQYEAGEVEESRHNMTTLEPVFDGISNTITTVQKDNLLLDNRHVVDAKSDYLIDGKNFNQRGVVHGTESVSRTLISSSHSGNEPKVTDGFRIRKLTPKECWRLQGIPDHYFYKAAYGHPNFPMELIVKMENRTMTREEYKTFSRFTRKRLTSDSQLYKQAGNACTVNVMYAIAKRMGYD